MTRMWQFMPNGVITGPMLWIQQSNGRMLQHLWHFYAHVIFEGGGASSERGLIDL